jgi:hypothetical protein
MRSIGIIACYTHFDTVRFDNLLRSSLRTSLRSLIISQENRDRLEVDVRIYELSCRASVVGNKIFEKRIFSSQTRFLLSSSLASYFCFAQRVMCIPSVYSLLLFSYFHLKNEGKPCRPFPSLSFFSFMRRLHH